MKKIVVVGGSSGMGLAIATLMRKEGYEITIASRSKEKLAQAVKVIGKAESYVLDVTQEAETQAFFDSHPVFDHLIISAADFVMGPFLELSLKEARQFFDSKFWGQYTVAKYAAPKMRENGSITFFSGIAGQKPFLNMAVASAINAAIEGLTRTLALELAPLRVNAIAPGTIATPIWSGVSEEEKKSFFQKISETLPAGRVGQPEDIAQVIKFLIACEYMTGQVISCDGGACLI
jgi:NAD(P)-dependent dehydrogenase (short-subunit alcohol dehydrogenase family)